MNNIEFGNFEIKENGSYLPEFWVRDKDRLIQFYSLKLKKIIEKWEKTESLISFPENILYTWE